jgi:hypothetical protein
MYCIVLGLKKRSLAGAWLSRRQKDSKSRGPKLWTKTHILHLIERHWKQGDRIGRIFAYWVIVYNGSFMKITYYIARLVWQFFNGNSRVNFDTKMSWATFWAILSQTHLVTLTGREARTHTRQNICFVSNFGAIKIDFRISKTFRWTGCCDNAVSSLTH